MASLSRVCVFCGSGVGTDPAFGRLAEALGSEIGNAGLGLVYGGAHVGLMGIVADATLEARGEVIGVIPESLSERELAHQGLTELIVVADMHERKKQMYERSDAFIAMPGGYGTLEEVFEATTWSQLGLHTEGHPKPLVLLDVGGFWEPLTDLLDKMVVAGFVLPQNRSLIAIADTPAGALEACSVRTTNHP